MNGVSHSKNGNDRLQSAAAVAGIISAVLAVASIVIPYINPTNQFLIEFRNEFPFIPFFLFLAFILCGTFWFILKVIERVQGVTNVLVSGDLIATNKVGEFVENNISGIEADQLGKIIEGISKSKDETLKEALENVQQPARRAMMERMFDKLPTEDQTDMYEATLKKLGQA